MLCLPLAFAAEHIQGVYIMTRHGIRAPQEALPNDTEEWVCKKNHLYTFAHAGTTIEPSPYLTLHFDVKNANVGSCFGGQLADQGYEQHTELSTIWKDLYPDLFNSDHLRTTIYPRVELSLLGQLTELNEPVSKASKSPQYLDTSTIPDNCSWHPVY